MMDERRDADFRDWIEPVMARAVEKGVISALSRYSPHDISTHEGGKAFEADQDFLHSTRRRCEKVQDKALTVVISGVGIVAVGVVWSSWDKIEAVIGIVK